MTIQDIHARKNALIQAILRLDNAAVLADLERRIKEEALFWQAIRPLRSNIQLSDLIKEQEYTPPTMSELQPRIDSLEINESVEELLELLDK